MESVDVATATEPKFKSHASKKKRNEKNTWHNDNGAKSENKHTQSAAKKVLSISQKDGSSFNLLFLSQKSKVDI